MCYSVDDVEKSTQGASSKNSANMAQAGFLLEQAMKVEVVLERQKNHLKSVEFAEKRLRSIRVEIDEVLKWKS